MGMGRRISVTHDIHWRIFDPSMSSDWLIVLLMDKIRRGTGFDERLRIKIFVLDM